MANNLAALRRSRRWTQEQIAAAMGTTRNQYAKLESGSRRLTDFWIERAATAFGIDAGEVVRGPAISPPVVGRIVGNSRVEWIDSEPNAGPRDLALEVDGDSIGPLFKGAHLVFIHVRVCPDILHCDRPAIVAIGCHTIVLARLLASAGNDQYHVAPTTGSPLMYQTVRWLSYVTRVVFLPRP